MNGFDYKQFIDEATIDDDDTINIKLKYRLVTAIT